MSLKVTALYTGQTRAFRKVWANQIYHILGKFPGLRIVCSMADDDDAEDMRILQREMPDVPFFMEKVVQPDMPKGALPKLCDFHCGYPPSSEPEAIWKQLWALNRGWEFFKSIPEVQDTDLFIRIRPDLSFLRAEWDDLYLLDCTGDGLARRTCLTPWWSRWGGINDRFAFLGRQAADAYFTTLTRLPEITKTFCPPHPESLMMHSLRSRGIEPDDTLKVEFMTIRKDGTYVPCDISTVDIADFARAR